MQTLQVKSLSLKNRVSVKIISLQLANYIFIKYHYLHRRRIMAQLAYGIYLDFSLVGALSFCYPMGSFTLHGCRPLEMLEFARMYLFKNLPHLATCSIGKALRRIKFDWSDKYSDKPLPRLIVSWSDNTRHVGTIYKASNFIEDAQTRGGRNGRLYGQRPQVNRPDFKHAKTRWIYWLR